MPLATLTVVGPPPFLSVERCVSEVSLGAMPGAEEDAEQEAARTAQNVSRRSVIALEEAGAPMIQALLGTAPVRSLKEFRRDIRRKSRWNGSMAQKAMIEAVDYDKVKLTKPRDTPTLRDSFVG